MSAEKLIANRYLFSKKKISLISSLTWISIGGITIGVSLLVIVLSVFNGFYDLIKELLLSNDPHIRIEHSKKAFFRDSLKIESLLAEDDVYNLDFYVEGEALISRSGRDQLIAKVKGIQSKNLNQSFNITQGIPFIGVKDKQAYAIVSEQLSQFMRLQIDDYVSVLTADGMLKSLTQFGGPRTLNFQIAGYFSLTDIVNEPIIIVDIRAAQRLFYLRNEISGIDITFVDEKLAFQYKELLQTKLGNKYKVSTWYDLQKPLYDIMEIEKWASYTILMIIVIVAILNIIGSLTMIVLQKKKDISILQSMGMSKGRIKNTFLLQGFQIGLIGAGLGGFIGLTLSLIQQYLGIIKLAGSEAFIISSYPISVSAFDVLLVVLSSLILCIAAAFLPSIKASETDISSQLRYD